MSGSFATMPTFVKVHNSNLQANSAKNSVHLSVLTVLLWEKKRGEREKKKRSELKSVE